MQDTKFQGHQPFGSVDFKCFFYHCMTMAAILVMRPGDFLHSVPQLLESQVCDPLETEIFPTINGASIAHSFSVALSHCP